MSALQNLLGSDRSWVSSRAALALHINASVQSGEMSKDEATELLNDLIATDKLDEEADSFEIRTELVNAITDLITVVSNVSSIPGL